MARGYNALADVLRTADGVDVNRLFTEIQAAVAARNAQRQRWLDLLTYRTTEVSETVLQVGDTSNIAMEEASEYGLPQGLRITGDFTTTTRGWGGRCRRRGAAGQDDSRHNLCATGC